MWKIKEWFLHYKEAIRVSLLALFRWTLLAVCTGVLCGGIGTLFHLAVEWVTEQRTEHVWLLWLLPAAGIAITALYKATGCVGKGTNDVLRAVQDGSSVTPWLVPAIFLGTVLTHLCGGSAGREGAALQMGGSIGWNIGRVLHFNNHDCRTATVCGMAAFFFGAVRYTADRDPVCDDGGGCGPDADRGVRALIFSAGRATISVVSSCKNDDADKLSSRSPCRREGCRPEGRAASSLPCAGLLPPQSAEENLCRVRPLQHSEWRAAKHAIRVEPWNASDFFRRFIP